MHPYLRLWRVGNAAMAALAIFVAAFMAVGLDVLEQAILLRAVLAAGVVLFFVGAGNALNDYYDYEVDKVNRPDRPLPSGAIPRRNALNFAMSCWAVAIALSIFINPLTVFVVLVNIVLMFSYESRWKGLGLPGNLTISYLTGSIFIFTGAAVGGLVIMLQFAVLAALATLGREVAKDVEDVEGDMGVRRTLPMRAGIRKASGFSAAAFLAAVALSPLPFLTGEFSVWYLAAVLPADAIFIYSGTVVFRDASITSKWAKYGMLLALLAFIVGRALA